jgi:hypothetical protein
MFYSWSEYNLHLLSSWYYRHEPPDLALFNIFVPSLTFETVDKGINKIGRGKKEE